MATSASTLGQREMSIGRVFERAFTALKTNPGVILGLAFAIGAVPVNNFRREPVRARR